MFVRMLPLIVNFSLMVALPLLLGWYIARRRQISWTYFGIGAATFILAQLAHIPFNYAVINNWLAQVQPDSERATLLLTSIFLGISAGLFEEGARYLSFRFWAKDARTWGKGLMMGAGHGGAESILLGVLGALNVTILAGYQAGYFQGLVPVEQAPQVGEAFETMLALPWFEMMLGAIERAFVLGVQLALSLIVMQVFTRVKLRWLLFAFGWHALIDAAVVYSASIGGIYISEAVVGLAALICLVIIFRLREPEPSVVRPEPLESPKRPQTIRIKATEDTIDNSRYL